MNELPLNTAYQALETRFAKVGHIAQILEVLHWDQATMMPAGGATDRSEQFATLEIFEHELLADPVVQDQIEEALAGGSLTEWQRANLEEMRRQIVHVTAVPADLIAACTHAATRCSMAWRTARKEDDFATLAPLLQEVFALEAKKAQAKGEALNLPPYEALMDSYEPGATCEQVDVLFAQLEDFLPDFLDDVIDKQERSDAIIPIRGTFPVAQQRELGRRVMKMLGFDFQHGRLDESLHPFCAGGSHDVRITSRYRDDDFVTGLMGIIHETGHALYEQGLPGEWRVQPVGRARGMSIHESQSLLMEMQACRSPEFLRGLAPIVKKEFEGRGGAWTAENLYRIYTHVERSLIRVDADEVTYPLHIILRYRLEQALLTGDLQVEDLPGAWAEGMKNMLGIEVPSDRMGCMQDIHWVQGSIGYFPSYTMGAMSAAQLYQAALHDVPGIPTEISRGNFGPLVSWLRENVHSKASSMTTNELLESATGQPLSADIFLAHLRQRYLPDGNWQAKAG